MQTTSNPTSWRLQDAKAQFSLLVEFALRGSPQHVTRRGKQAVVVVSEEDFNALQRSARAASPSFVAHLLAMPKTSQKGNNKVRTAAPHTADKERTKIALRDIDFS